MAKNVIFWDLNRDFLQLDIVGVQVGLGLTWANYLQA